VSGTFSVLAGVTKFWFQDSGILEADFGCHLTPLDISCGFSTKVSKSEISFPKSSPAKLYPVLIFLK
jgi:hypothetical protein